MSLDLIQTVQAEERLLISSTVSFVQTEFKVALNVSEPSKKLGHYAIAINPAGVTLWNGNRGVNFYSTETLKLLFKSLEMTKGSFCDFQACITNMQVTIPHLLAVEIRNNLGKINTVLSNVLVKDVNKKADHV